MAFVPKDSKVDCISDTTEQDRTEQNRIEQNSFKGVFKPIVGLL